MHELGVVFYIVQEVEKIANANNVERVKKGKSYLSYYWFYPEAWANKLGGVK